jgi:CubicO group peptidase (beta-lactamase class C family)
MKNTGDLEAYFNRLVANDAFSGVVLVTQGAQTLYAAAYGYASRAWKIPNTLETRFDTASITKLFTAVAALQLIDRGALHFDTRAVDFLALRDTAISPDANVFHLLTHTSGIGDDCEEEDGEVYEEVWKSKANYSVMETADFLPQFADKKANFPPGQGCRYCNCAFVLLGLMVEKASGMAYRDYVRRHVFAPVGMARSDFFRMDRANENVAEGCDPIRDGDKTVAWKRNIYSYPPIGSPDGGAHVTAGDLDRFLRALEAGDLLSPQLSAAFVTPQVDYRSDADWIKKFSYGLLFYLDPNGKTVCYQKEGINAGASGVIRRFPGRDLNVVLLSNMEEGAWDPLWHIHDKVEAGYFD